MTNYDGFANRFRELRAQAGKTQHEVASDLHTSAQAVSQWERGLRLPRSLGQVATYFGVSVDYLMGRDTEPAAGGTSFIYMTVQNDLMAPEIQKGDRVVIDPAAEVSDGDIVALQGGQVRRYRSYSFPNGFILCDAAGRFTYADTLEVAGVIGRVCRVERMC